jgi:cyanate permease
MHGAGAVESNSVNPPGALLMGVIAFLSFNLSMGCMFGPFGVLIAPIEQRLGVSREISTLAVPIVTFGISLLAPFVGSLTSRISLRLMMLAGSLLMAAGFAVLALANSVVLFIGAYALLISPGLCICGVVAPTTLVTRWFHINCGRALGLATTPALMAATPLLVTFVLKNFGLGAAYGLLAGLMLVCAVASFFAVDRPERTHANAETVDPRGDENKATSEPSPPNVFRDSRFWRLALAGGLYNAVIVMFSTQLVPFALGEGIDPTRAALLLTAYLVGTLIGTPLFGWFADKVGGARMIGLLCVLLALWQGLLLTQPSYAFLALLAGLAGLQGAAMISCLGLALSERFGQNSFATAYGMANLVGLPFAVLSVPIASGLFVRTGSYSPAFLLATTVLMIGAVLAFSIGRRSAIPTRA